MTGWLLLACAFLGAGVLSLGACALLSWWIREEPEDAADMARPDWRQR